MNLNGFIKKSVAWFLRKIGWEFHRISKNSISKEIKPPPLLDDPLEALLLHQSGKKIAFKCPVELCRVESGFGFGLNQWHPFVAFLRQNKKSKNLNYKGSLLQQYYDEWNPKNAGQAIAGFDHPPKLFARLLPYNIFLTPWTSWSPQNFHKIISKWYKYDFLEHGRPEFDLMTHGSNSFGPVSAKMGKFEFDRLLKIFNQLKTKGYRRELGDIGVMIIRRQSDYRFLIAGGGQHRAAAMAAHGKTHFPAQFKVDYFVADVKDAAYWPQVRSGLWTEREALLYVDHLFHFDSKSWANAMRYTV